ncbi:MAG: sirohydrochlorin cobaltochelatase [Lachnospiraceae bacterium]|jgi:cobalamin biosynthesis Co2+ chelatase CbiK|nr:sirohydrochlorin cobaltochelatase [Lachnospiraceae bacterium]
MSKKAILVVSFGTTVEDTRKKTIDAIEDDIKKAFPDYAIYSAWTSRKIAAKTGHPLIKDAMKDILADGVTDLFIQPTHIMKAIEYNTIVDDVEEFRDKFDSLKVGKALIYSRTDIDRMARFLNTTYRNDVGIKDNEILLFMGHGTDHVQNKIYTDIAHQLAVNDYKCDDIFIGTVEGKPDFDDIVKVIDGNVPDDTTFILAPLMIVAGVHAHDDLMGDEADSWKSVLESKGYKVRGNMKGLGEYPEVRNRFVELVKENI